MPDALQDHRTPGSRTPGHPEYHHADGIELTTGPLGPGVAEAVGMALSERIMNANKVFLFDPLDPEGRIARYNPLACVRCGSFDASEDIQRIAQMIFPDLHGRQAFLQD